MLQLKKNKQTSPVVVGEKGGKASVAIAGAALSVFIAGGLATFSGLGCFLLMKNRPFLSFGDGRSFGMLLVFGGLGLSVFGVLMMRIARNRWLK